MVLVLLYPDFLRKSQAPACYLCGEALFSTCFLSGLQIFMLHLQDCCFCVKMLQKSQKREFFQVAPGASDVAEQNGFDAGFM